MLGLASRKTYRVHGPEKRVFCLSCFNQDRDFDKFEIQAMKMSGNEKGWTSV